MKTTHLLSIFALLAVALVIGCNKDDDTDTVNTNEPIYFITPDSTTIISSPGAQVDYTVQLTLDENIDSLRAGWVIDTIGMVTSIPFSSVDSVFLETGFADSNNVQQFSGSITVPDSIINVRAFQVCDPPSLPQDYDALRLIFRVEAGTIVREKQLKVIVCP